MKTIIIDGKDYEVRRKDWERLEDAISEQSPDEIVKSTLKMVLNSQDMMDSMIDGLEEALEGGDKDA